MEFLSSAGTERTAFVLFCAIALLALLLTTVMGTDPAPESDADSVGSLRTGLFERPRRTEADEPQNAVGGYRSGITTDEEQ